MHTTLRSFAAAAVSISLPAVNAFWRLECDGSVGTARIDPLMDFGGTSDHIHSIKGGSGKFAGIASLGAPFTSNIIFVKCQRQWLYTAYQPGASLFLYTCTLIHN